MLGVLVLGLVGLGPLSAGAAEWGTITPGTSTTATVQTQFGPASKTSKITLDGYETTQWVYEGAQAPVGMQRMTVDFGLLTPVGYHPDVVRLFRLEPKLGVFTQKTILQGWGPPSRSGRDQNIPVFYYEDGLMVYFDDDGLNAERMIFTLRQPHREN